MNILLAQEEDQRSAVIYLGAGRTQAYIGIHINKFFNHHVTKKGCNLNCTPLLFRILSQVKRVLLLFWQLPQHEATRGSGAGPC